MRGYIKTILDMEREAYGPAFNFFNKDAPALTTTTGFWTALFGWKVWSQLNQEANAFGVLKKSPWERSGVRVITARAASSGGGVAENGDLPATIKPTLLTYYTKPKSIAHTFDVSEVLQFLGERDDGLGDTMKMMREEIGKHHVEMMNVMLLADADTALAGNNAESIDRAICSKSEVDGCFTNATYGNIYTTIDRTDAAYSWADAYVSHASGVDRDLTLNLLNTAFTNVWQNGGRPKVIMTGYDTLQRIQELLQAQQRFMEVKRIVPTHNGIEGIAGVEGGFMVATYNGVPIIASKNVKQDTISRIYFLDTDYLEFKVAKPTAYLQNGINTGDPFGIGRLGDEGLYRTMGELICTFFKAQGKIRDLQ